MAKQFKDPIEPSERKNGYFAWSFKAPTKDQATSGCISAGDSYGVGFRTPVGKEKASSMMNGPIPFGRREATSKEVIDEKK